MTSKDQFGVFSRRDFLAESYLGLGGLALLDLLASDSARAATGKSAQPLALRNQHIPAKAKNCIFLFMEGGVSQMDTFEYKPALEKYRVVQYKMSLKRRSVSSTR
jgi:hypothetical protein